MSSATTGELERLLLALVMVPLIPSLAICAQIPTERLAAEILDEAPQGPSPWVTDDGREFVTGLTRDGRYFRVSVTVENGEPPDYRNRQWWGKGRQLAVDSSDFPTLAGTGLHSAEELDQTKKITGVPVTDITRRARPGAYSGAGFISHEEDIVSVLEGDNRLVARLELTHPQLSRPLFHVFNLILSVRQDSERGNVAGIIYDGRKIDLRFWGHKGWQESIFDDEILGYWEIEIHRELDREEMDFFNRRYSHLTTEELAELIERLTFIHTGEMVPFYITRYGFYEGHTSYRADPLAIAWIFGLKSLPELDSAFEGRLYQVLTDHHLAKSPAP